jgi:hypothetical protein
MAWDAWRGSGKAADGGLDQNLRRARSSRAWVSAMRSSSAASSSAS